jgi:hypothetical protein
MPFDRQSPRVLRVHPPSCGTLTGSVRKQRPNTECRTQHDPRPAFVGQDENTETDPSETYSSALQPVTSRVHRVHREVHVRQW